MIYIKIKHKLSLSFIFMVSFILIIIYFSFYTLCNSFARINSANNFKTYNELLKKDLELNTFKKYDSFDFIIFSEEKIIFNSSDFLYTPDLKTINLNEMKFFTSKNKKFYGIHFKIQENLYSLVYSDEQSLLINQNSIMLFINVIIIFLFLISIVYSFFIANNFSSPIIHIMESLKFFDPDNQKQLFDYKKGDEIDEIKIYLNEFANAIYKLENDKNQFNQNIDLIGLNYKEKIIELEKEITILKNKILVFENSFDNYKDLIISLTDKNKSFDELYSHILDIAYKLVNDADTGSISVIDGENWRFVATIGHDLAKLQKIPLKKESMILSENIEIFGDLCEYDNFFLGTDFSKMMADATIPMKQSIMVPIKINNKILGSLVLDISKNSAKSFDNTTIKIMEVFTSILTTILTLNNHSEIEEKMQMETMTSIIKILEMHDSYTKSHSEFVAHYSYLLAKKIGMDEADAKKIYFSGLLHDIGKILIQHKILKGADSLSNDEFNLIKMHPVYAFNILNTSDALKDTAKIILYHHEKYDGTGYPEGLKGKQIPIESRIISIVDAWDAMIHDRTYRTALPKNEASEELLKCKNTQFDPVLVDLFIEMESELNSDFNLIKI